MRDQGLGCILEELFRGRKRGKLARRRQYGHGMEGLGQGKELEGMPRPPGVNDEGTRAPAVATTARAAVHRVKRTIIRGTHTDIQSRQQRVCTCMRTPHDASQRSWWQRHWHRLTEGSVEASPLHHLWHLA